MSIQSEITRISGNVSDALTAIEGKGVTVPAGSNSDDLADLINSIVTSDVYKTVSGEIVSFDDGGNNLAVKELSVGIEPVQDLHGYSNPWLAGETKNMLSLANLQRGYPSSTTYSNSTKRTFENAMGCYIIGLTNNNYFDASRASQFSVEDNYVTLTTSAIAYDISVPVTGLIAGNNYCFSAAHTGRLYASFYENDGTFISSAGPLTNASTFVVPADTYWTLLHFGGGINNIQAIFTNIQLESGSTKTSYIPCSNICPINGYSGVNISQTNEFSSRTITISLIQNGSGDPSPTNVRSISPGLVLTRDDESTLSVYGGTLDIINQVLTVDRFASPISELSFTYQSSYTRFYTSLIQAFAEIPSSSTTNLICEVFPCVNDNMSSKPNNSVFMASSGNLFIANTTYDSVDSLKSAVGNNLISYKLAVPINYKLSYAETKRAAAALGVDFDTTSVSWQSEAGTVYKGNLNVKTGLLTVTHKYINFNGTENWAISSAWGKTNTAVFYISGYLNDVAYATDTNPLLACNEFISASRDYIYDNDVECAGFSGSLLSTAPTVRINKTRASTAANFKTWLEKNNLQYVYQLITPLTYQLTPTTVRTLLGDNVMWADTGSMDLTYYTLEAGSELDFTDEWKRPSKWPTLPNDIGTYSGVYYLFKKIEGKTTYYISYNKPQGADDGYDIGLTDSSGVFTSLLNIGKEEAGNSFDISNLNILGDYFWLRGLRIGTYLTDYPFSYEPILETIVSNTNRTFYSGTAAGQTINCNTIHFIANNWTRNYVYDFDYCQDYRVALQCVEFYGGSWERPMTFPLNCNKIVISNVNVTVKDGKIFNSNYGGGVSRYRNVSFGTIDLNNQTAFSLRLGSGNSAEAQSIIDKCGDFSAITSIEYFLANCHNVTSINLTGRKITAVTNVKWAFQNTPLTSITWGETDFSGATSFRSMFDGCRNMPSISIPGTTIHITENEGMNYAFRNCMLCTTIDLSNVDFTSNVNFTSAFSNCTSLVNLTFKANAGIAWSNFDLSSCTNLSAASLVSAFNALATTSSAKTIKLGNTNKAKLTAAELAIATEKGWTVT